MKPRSRLTSLHALLVRRAGGRKVIPKGSLLDQVIRTALEDALFAGACAERSGAIGRIGRLRAGAVTADDRRVLNEAEDAVRSVPITAVVHDLTRSPA